MVWTADGASASHRAASFASCPPQPRAGLDTASRDYTGLDDDAGHKVDGSFRVAGVAITSKPERETPTAPANRSKSP